MRLGKLALLLGLVALLTTAVLAQQPGGRGFGRGGFGRGGGAMLLVNKSVQTELKLTQEQVDKVAEMTKQAREDFRKLMNEDTSDEDKKAIRKKMAEEGPKAVKTILNADQQKRLKEIQNQQMGVALLEQEETQKALKLSDDQKEKIKTIQEDATKEMRELFQGGGRGSPETMKKFQGLRKEAMTKATNLLNDTQKAALKELLGKPFEIQGGFGGGRGRGGRRGGDA